VQIHGDIPNPIKLTLAITLTSDPEVFLKFEFDLAINRFWRVDDNADFLFCEDFSLPVRLLWLVGEEEDKD
jgi:hypothetical protein